MEDTQTKITISGDVFSKSVSDDCSPFDPATFDIIKFSDSDRVSFIVKDTELLVPKKELANILNFLLEN